MIRSMTAFARQEMIEPWGQLTLELRSVNHRYLEIGMRLPEELRVLETRIRESINNKLNRGKVDVLLRYQAEQQTTDELALNETLVQQLATAVSKVQTYFAQTRPVNPLEVIRWPGILQTPEVDQEVLHETCMNLVETALDELLRGREREGEKISDMITQRCDGIETIVSEVKTLIPDIRQAWREKLLAKLEEFKADIDASRLEQEMAFMAQKIDVEEEIDRLLAHVNEVRRVLKHDKPVGRRLDFLMQELNREANTLGSKSTDARTGTASVDLKVLIEQMREQVQNIE